MFQRKKSIQKNDIVIDNDDDIKTIFFDFIFFDSIFSNYFMIFIFCFEIFRIIKTKQIKLNIKTLSTIIIDLITIIKYVFKIRLNDHKIKKNSIIEFLD